MRTKKKLRSIPLDHEVLQIILFDSYISKSYNLNHEISELAQNRETFLLAVERTMENLFFFLSVRA